jgi:hypothetical protein
VECGRSRETAPRSELAGWAEVGEGLGTLLAPFVGQRPYGTAQPALPLS